MNQMNKMICAAIGILIASLTSGAQAQMPEIPANLKQMVSQALQASETATMGKYNQQTSAQQKYEATMAQIADTVDPELAGKLKAYEGESVEAKIITIAVHKKQNPEMHKKINEVYFTSYPTERIVYRAPPLAGEFREEKYRLAWEYYILACAIENRPELSDRKPIDAVGTIGNSKSIILLETALNQVINQSLLSDSKIKTRMRMLFSAMFKLDASVAFDSIITAMKEIDELGYTIGIGGEDRDIYYLYAETVFHNMPAEQLAQWKQAAESYPKDKLDQQQQEFLGNIFATATQ